MLVNALFLMFCFLIISCLKSLHAFLFVLWNTGQASTIKCRSYAPPRWPDESHPGTGHFLISMGCRPSMSLLTGGREANPEPLL